ncbi:unnamed protein product [Moneuplotes crassus]|uniref:Uncharacterized protein n=1 Tax=Euplotes crassus TaxID=5936 RepID=A0AAD2CYR9_EUPCR|nr:unnamed protein product [Moneuplotes crassus]
MLTENSPTEEDQEELDRERALAQARREEQEMLQEAREYEQKETLRIGSRAKDAIFDQQRPCPSDQEGTLDPKIMKVWSEVSDNVLDTMATGAELGFTINRVYYNKWNFIHKLNGEKLEKKGVEEQQKEGVKEGEKEKSSKYSALLKYRANLTKTIASEANITETINAHFQLPELEATICENPTLYPHYRDPYPTPGLHPDVFISLNLQKPNKSRSANAKENIPSGSATKPIRSGAQLGFIKETERLAREQSKRVTKHKGFKFGASNKKFKFIR